MTPATAMTPIIAMTPPLKISQRPYGLEDPSVLTVCSKHPKNVVEQCFEEWLSYARQDHRPFSLMMSAQQILTQFKIEPAIDELCQIIAHHQNHPLITLAGPFVSEAINRSLEWGVVYPGCGDVVLSYVGYALSRRKVLVVPEGVRTNNCGDQSEGVILFNGIESESGWFSSTGLTVFNGEASIFGGGNAGLTVCLKDPERFGHGGQTIYRALIRRDLHELHRYLKKLVAPFSSRFSYEHQSEVARGYHADTIRLKVSSILRMKGYASGGLLRS